MGLGNLLEINIKTKHVGIGINGGGVENEEKCVSVKKCSEEGVCYSLKSSGQKSI